APSGVVSCMSRCALPQGGAIGANRALDVIRQGGPLRGLPVDAAPVGCHFVSGHLTVDAEALRVGGVNRHRPVSDPGAAVRVECDITVEHGVAVEALSAVVEDCENSRGAIPIQELP